MLKRLTKITSAALAALVILFSSHSIAGNTYYNSINEAYDACSAAAGVGCGCSSTSCTDNYVDRFYATAGGCSPRSSTGLCLLECPANSTPDGDGVCSADPCVSGGGYYVDGQCVNDITIEASNCSSDDVDYQGNVVKDGVTTHICASDYSCDGGQFGVVNGITACVPDNFGPTTCAAGTFTFVDDTSGTGSYVCEPLDNNPPESGDCMFVKDAFDVQKLQCRGPDGEVIDPNSPDHKSNGGDGDGSDRNDPQSPDDPTSPVDGTITKGDQLIADKLDDLIDNSAVVDGLDALGTDITDSIDGLTEEYNGSIDGDISSSIGSLTGDISGGALDPENVVSDMFSADYFGDAEDNMKDLAIHIDTFEGIGVCNDLVISSLLGHNFVLPCSALQKVRDVLGYVFYIWTVLVLFELLTTPITLSRN
ncbi:MAG: hypothetical protein KUG53_03825 [Pseudomonadales bacterium]|nr:hypothetical protein [Pseudomonadales bacterium]